MYWFTPVMMKTVRLVYGLRVLLSAGFQGSLRGSPSNFQARVRGEHRRLRLLSFPLFGGAVGNSQPDV